MFRPEPMKDEDFDFDLNEFNRAFDKVQAHVFMGKNAAFLAPLLCSMNVVWSMDIPTACTSGITITINPQFFMSLPFKTQCFVLMHEIWHTANLYFLRIGDRDPQLFNFAADISINNMLHKLGYTWSGFTPWFDLRYGDMPDEDIYDDLIARGFQVPDTDSFGLPLVPGQLPGDMLEPEEGDQSKVIHNVLKARHQAIMQGKPGDVPGSTESILKQFLKPVVPWESELRKWMTELSNHRHTWKRPNRRHQNIYLPGRTVDRSKLAHLVFYWDVSGSISDKDVIRMMSEVRYIKDYFKPDKLTLVQFDVNITSVQEFSKDDQFEEIKVIGRGGTDLRCVREDMIERKPTAAIIFTDLGCAPMQPLLFDIPLLWIAINAHSDVPFGRKINIRT